MIIYYFYLSEKWRKT